MAVATKYSAQRGKALEASKSRLVSRVRPNGKAGANNHKREEYKITVTRKWGYRQSNRQDGINEAPQPKIEFRNDAAIAVDHDRYAAVRRPRDRQPFLDRADSRDQQMLLRSRIRTKP